MFLGRKLVFWLSSATYKDLSTSLEDNALLFNWRIIVYHIVLVSVMQQHESAVGTHVPSLLNLPRTTHTIPALYVATECRI